jgi:predicted RNase H-like HicB family nuclease
MRSATGRDSPNSFRLTVTLGRLRGKLELRLFLEQQRMSEIIFLVEEADEGGYTARAVNESIFTEADTLDELRQNVREAVECHFEDDAAPKVIRLHIVREEIITA